jgi:hypothetical protein
MKLITAASSISSLTGTVTHGLRGKQIKWRSSEREQREGATELTSDTHLLGGGDAIVSFVQEKRHAWGAGESPPWAAQRRAAGLGGALGQDGGQRLQHFFWHAAATTLRERSWETRDFFLRIEIRRVRVPRFIQLAARVGPAKYLFYPSCFSFLKRHSSYMWLDYIAKKKPTQVASKCHGKANFRMLIFLILDIITCAMKYR